MCGSTLSNRLRVIGHQVINKILFKLEKHKTNDLCQHKING